jgi:DNA-directed RNA polymerase sigma subunit (sigma70/sigma32)
VRSGKSGAGGGYRGVFYEAVRGPWKNFDYDPCRFTYASWELVTPLPKESEAICFQHLRAGVKKLNRPGKIWWKQNLALVVAVAERYASDRRHVLDLIIEGNNALLRALDTARDSHEVSFAAHGISQAERAIASAVATSGSSRT